MLDINLFRIEKGGNPELIKESQRRRGASVEIIKEIIALDQSWVKIRFNVDEVNKKINATQKQIGLKMKAKEDVTALVEEKKELEREKERLAKDMEEKETQRNEKLQTVGNVVHSSVPTSQSEDENRLEELWTPDGVERKVKSADILSHHELLAKIGGYDPQRGAKVASHRGYFLTGPGVDLNQALINYGLHFLSKRGYTKMQTPYFMLKKEMAKTAQLSQFDEELYKVEDGSEQEKYLIATSEQPISAFHSDEWLRESDLPIRYAGYSTCFRKEAGSHGKDTWGVFRVHQFEKVEQFILTAPEKSWEAFEDMLTASKEFYQSLGLPYRIVSIVSGALNNAASKKCDLEAWFPFQGEYKELVSCSNCTDFQSRHLEIRYGSKKMNEREKKYVHCLNGTLCATTRTLSCILENCQTKEGIVVPEVLRPFMNGTDFIPFK